MAEQKTKPTSQSVEAFIESIDKEQVRDDCRALIKLMQKVTKSDAVMWGTSIIGFGKYQYKYESGHEGFSCLTGFSPRKQAITLYIMRGFKEYAGLAKELGKHKASVGCLYIKKLEDIDTKVLEQLVQGSVKYLREKFPKS